MSKDSGKVKKEMIVFYMLDSDQLLLVDRNYKPRL